MSRSGLLAALAVLSLTASPVAAQPIVLGGDVVVPVENRPELGLFVQGYINGHGPYRFALSFLDETILTTQVVRELGLATEPAGMGVGALTNQVANAVAAKQAEIRIGGKTVTVNDAWVIPERNPSAYTPVPSFAGYIGLELLRNGFVTLNATRSQIRFAPRSLDETGEAGSTAITLENSATNGIAARPGDPIPSMDLPFGGKRARLRLVIGGSAFVFFNTSALGAALIKASPYRFESRAWTPDGVTILVTGATTDVDIGGRHLRTAAITRVADKAPYPADAAIKGIPVEGLVGLGMTGGAAFSIDNDAGIAWVGPGPVQALPATSASVPKTPSKMIGLTPWLYKGRGVALVVVRGGPADLAGIAPGDEIVSLNGEGVVEYYEHIDPKAKSPPPLTVVFRNGSGVHTVVLEPGLPRLD